MAAEPFDSKRKFLHALNQSSDPVRDFGLTTEQMRVFLPQTEKYKRVCGDLSFMLLLALIEENEKTV